MCTPHPFSGRFVNPARAGMILVRAAGVNEARRKPRASGDDPSGRGNARLDLV